MSVVTTIRLDKNLLKSLNELARREYTARTKVVSELIEIGLKEKLLVLALEKYKKEKITAWKAASEANVTLWEFLEILKARGIPFKTSEDELREMLESL